VAEFRKNSGQMRSDS